MPARTKNEVLCGRLHVRKAAAAVADIALALKVQAEGVSARQQVVDLRVVWVCGAGRGERDGIRREKSERRAGEKTVTKDKETTSLRRNGDSSSKHTRVNACMHTTHPAEKTSTALVVRPLRSVSGAIHLGVSAWPGWLRAHARVCVCARCESRRGMIKRGSQRSKSRTQRFPRASPQTSSAMGE